MQKREGKGKGPRERKEEWGWRVQNGKGMETYRMEPTPKLGNLIIYASLAYPGSELIGINQ
jgi:hypothetical protein